MSLKLNIAWFDRSSVPIKRKKLDADLVRCSIVLDPPLPSRIIERQADNSVKHIWRKRPRADKDAEKPSDHENQGWKQEQASPAHTELVDFGILRDISCCWGPDER